jgi:leader peptidase (prepilin peptidase)/N-methyltransferase
MEDDVVTAFALSPAAYSFAFVLGALFGSFANVCIARVPLGMSVVRPPSHCFSCKTPVRWFDNLPLVSYLLLRGRCRHCHAGYSPRYLLVEAAVGLCFVFTYHLCVSVWGAGELMPHRLARFGIYAFFELVLVVITFIDLDHKLIPDSITFPSIPIFFALGQLLGDVSWTSRLIGVAVGYGVVRAISDLYWLLARREGLGYGDGKLLAVIGALFGWPAVLESLFGGALLGSVIGTEALLAARRGAPAAAPPVPGSEPSEAPGSFRHVEIPFGPFIVTAAFGYLVFQTQLAVRVFPLFWPS